MIRDHAKLPARYYLRFTVEDHPSVLSQIAGALGSHQISIASVIQHEPPEDGEGGTVPLVIMTHADHRRRHRGGRPGNRPPARASAPAACGCACSTTERAARPRAAYSAVVTAPV